MGKWSLLRVSIVSHWASAPMFADDKVNSIADVPILLSAIYVMLPS